MTRREKNIPSDRSFGIFLLALASAALLYYLYFHGFPPVYLTSSIFILLTFFTIFFPVILRPFKASWLFLGLILSMIFTPLIIRVIFYFVVTPFAIFGRVFKKDELLLKKPNKKSYWVTTKQRNISKGFFIDQF